VAVGSSPLSHSIAYKGFFDKLVTVTTPGSETSVSRRLFQVTGVWGTKGKAGFSRDAQKAQEELEGAARAHLHCALEDRGGTLLGYVG
jgi:hypothetical protein